MPNRPTLELPPQVLFVPPDLRESFYYPSSVDRSGTHHRLVLELTRAIDFGDRLFPKGFRGTIFTGQLGNSGFDYHTELPLDGWGLPKSVLRVVEQTPTGRIVRTPYRRWCQRLGLVVWCRRCGLDLTTDRHRRCPG